MPALNLRTGMLGERDCFWPSRRHVRYSVPILIFARGWYSYEHSLHGRHRLSIVGQNLLAGKKPIFWSIKYHEMPAEEANMNTIFIARVKFQKHPSSGIRGALTYLVSVAVLPVCFTKYYQKQTLFCDPVHPVYYLDQYAFPALPIPGASPCTCNKNMEDNRLVYCFWSVGSLLGIFSQVVSICLPEIISTNVHFMET
jgi:hypothetical protein